MSSRASFHSLPTHLGVRDPVLWGLNDVQLLKLGAGVLGAGFVWRQTGVPFGVRAALGIVLILASAASALVRIEGRPLEDWLLIFGRYVARPRSMVWRSRQTDHPWAIVRATTPMIRPSRVSTRYCLRHIRVRWAQSDPLGRVA